MKKLLLTVAITFAALSSLRADTAYLLIQGAFGAGGTIATYKWKLLYESGALGGDIYGQSLFDNVFGLASVVSAGTGPSGSSLLSAGNSTQGATYYEYSWGRMLDSITLGGVTLAPSGNNGWNYYLAGGGGFITYPAGQWTYASDGLGTRTLSDGSFDGWVFGDLGTYDPEIDGFTGTQTIVQTFAPGDNNPNVGNFSTATVINTVPEPGSAGLLLLGAAGFCARRRR